MKATQKTRKAISRGHLRRWAKIRALNGTTGPTQHERRLRRLKNLRYREKKARERQQETKAA
jgi:hypothetical protein